MVVAARRISQAVLGALLVGAAAASLATAGAGSVGRVTATDGPWRAVFSYTKTGDGPQSYSRLHLTVAKSTALILDVPVSSRLRGTAYLQPGGYGSEKTISFRDLDGNGVPELLLVLFTGGAHCCFIEQVYDLSAARPKRAEISFADAGSKIVLVRGRPLFQSADESFAYVFTDYADSGAPIQLWSYAHGQFKDVTRTVPALVAKDAAFWWKLARGRLKAHGDERGILSAWAADKALLGESAAAKRTLLRLAAGGALDGGSGAPKGSAYVRKLWAFLRAEHYVR